MNLRLSGVKLEKTSFVNDFRALPDALKKEARARIRLLLSNSQAGKLRCHPLNGYNPTIYSIDVAPNKTHKATFRIEDGFAVFLRIGTHKHIDRCPE